MISINVNESKKLRFKISLSGIQPQDLKGSMRIMMEKVEYGFPIKIDKGDIVVDINPICEIYGKNVKDGSLLDAKLEVIAGEHYLVPWQDKIRVDNPIKLEAKVEDIVEELKEMLPVIKVSDISEDEIKKEEKTVIKEEKKVEVEKKIQSRFSEIFK